MLVAITGVTGFLGQRTLAALRRQGHSVRGVLRGKEVPAELGTLLDEHCFGDQYDALVQRQFVADAGAVIHIGMDWNALNDGPQANLERNVAGTLKLVEAARQAGAGQFVFVSSLDVYGDAVRSGTRLTEKDSPLPDSIYGAFKASVEMHLCAYHASFGVNTSSWRPAAMYGLRPGSERSLWLDVVRRVRRGEMVAESTTADVVSVDHVAEALALAIGDENVAGHTYNLHDVRLAWTTVSVMARRLIEKSDGAPYVGLQAQESRFDSKKAMDFFARHGRHEALRQGLAGVANYLGSLLSSDAGS